MLAALMAVLDISIVNVALNDIRASFATPIDQIGWVSTGYMMANIVVIPMTGWFQRRFGFRRLGDGGQYRWPGGVGPGHHRVGARRRGRVRRLAVEQERLDRHRARRSRQARRHRAVAGPLHAQ